MTLQILKGHGSKRLIDQGEFRQSRTVIEDVRQALVVQIRYQEIRCRWTMDAPDIRHHVGQFLDKKSAPACISVSKDWFESLQPFVYQKVKPQFTTGRRRDGSIKMPTLLSLQMYGCDNALHVHSCPFHGKYDIRLFE
ncbi:hypothetical protein BGZ83_010006 [Gryganskiella cystojenkinii]|nr:hypothetical protein BGZ83_010006 [Gryganskiella cystojenkinii]